ncbi:MAG: ATP-binding protein [Candidatus Eremiobacteraeota bacterium]|nr:ATP-binding protein [Candidatus Eremiobacteraeota bacterium]
MFTTPEELLARIRLGEDSFLELKTVHFRGKKVSSPARNTLADELAAFANTHDGVLLLGIDDSSREIVGIPLDKLDAVESYIREVCSDSIKPPLIAAILKMELPDREGAMKPVVKVEVPRSLFVHKSPGGYFNRVGSSKREMSTEQLARLLQQRSQARIIRFDEEPVPGTGIHDIEESLWKRFLPHTMLHEPLVALSKMRILCMDSSGKERVSVGGLLLCSAHPEACLPQAYIEAVRYRGVKRDSNFQVNARQIVGPLDQQIEQALLFTRLSMTVAARKVPYRVEYPQFSMRALFEAVVNAVAHRDYSIYASKIRLYMFDDRLELYSPGALANTLTVESLSLRQATRNELITSLLSRCPVRDDDAYSLRSMLMDRRGEGVPIIIDESEKLSGRAPEYRLIDDAELLLTIYAAGPPEEP